MACALRAADAGQCLTPVWPTRAVGRWLHLPSLQCAAAGGVQVRLHRVGMKSAQEGSSAKEQRACRPGDAVPTKRI